MRNNTKKSPVVYWTSKWVETDKIEISNYSDNTKKEVCKILKGYLNPMYTRLRIK